MAWTQAGNHALAQIWQVVYGTARNGFDPFDNNTFQEWHPTLTRIGFDQAIIDYVYTNAPADNGLPAWYTCKYCNFEYPKERCEIDHIIPWETYCELMTTTRPLADAKALQIWAGCNDFSNLALACKPCNGSKNNRPATPAWVQQRQTLANQQGGF